MSVIRVAPFLVVLIVIGLSAAVRIAGMLALAPGAEDLLFRGLFLNWLSARLRNVSVAIAAQALVFVALHGVA